MDTISALMEALKRKEKDSSNFDDDAPPSAVKISIAKAIPKDKLMAKMGGMSDAMSDDEGDEDSPKEEGDETAHNAAVVDALQSDYPKIYEKIVANLDDHSEADTSDLSDMM